MNQKDMHALLEELKGNGAGKLSGEILEKIKNYVMIVPAVLPKNTDPKIIRQMAAASGKNVPIPQGVNPQPVTLANQEGNTFLPVFTSEEEKQKDTTGANFPLSINMPFEQCMNLVLNNPKIYGIAINPFSQNVIMQLQAAKEKEERQEEKKEMTIGQYHLFSRQRFEADVFPKQFFQKKSQLIDALIAERGECIKAIYDEVYDDEIANPYTAEDFDVLSLSLSEDFTILQIRFPGKYVGANICPMAIIGYEITTEKIWYYAILCIKQEEPLHLMQIMEDGTLTDLGYAPKVGNELTEVIDRIRGEKEE